MKYRQSVFLIAILMAIFCAVANPPPAAAQSLDQAKAQGLVGETARGYIEPVNSNPAMQRLADQINLQRKQNYRDIARKNGTTLEAIEAIAGAKLIGRAARG